MVAPKRKTCYQTENATANQETHPYYTSIHIHIIIKNTPTSKTHPHVCKTHVCKTHPHPHPHPYYTSKHIHIIIKKGGPYSTPQAHC